MRKTYYQYLRWNHTPRMKALWLATTTPSYQVKEQVKHLEYALKVQLEYTYQWGSRLG